MSSTPYHSLYLTHRCSEHGHPIRSLPHLISSCPCFCPFLPFFLSHQAILLQAQSPLCSDNQIIFCCSLPLLIPHLESLAPITDQAPECQLNPGHSFGSLRLPKSRITIKLSKPGILGDCNDPLLEEFFFFFFF